MARATRICLGVETAPFCWKAEEQAGCQPMPELHALEEKECGEIAEWWVRPVRPSGFIESRQVVLLALFSRRNVQLAPCHQPCQLNKINRFPVFRACLVNVHLKVCLCQTASCLLFVFSGGVALAILIPLLQAHQAVRYYNIIRTQP